MLDAGADKVSVNSAAVARPELLGGAGRGVRRPVRGAGDRRPARGGRLLRRLRQRRPHAGRARRRRVGARGRRARGGGDPAHEHGPRRHRGRLRARADPGGGGRRRRAGDRLGRRRHARPPRRRGRARAAPTRCCAPRSSTTGSTRCARPRSACARPGSRSGSDDARRPGDLRERVRRVPGMERLLPALEGLPPAYLVGGAVRDLLRGARGRSTSTSRSRATRARSRGRSPSGSAARRASTSASAPRRSRAGELAFDLATTRQRDLRRAGRAAAGRAGRRSPRTSRRRDFTINAMAVGPHRRRPRPPLRPATAGSRDLEARRRPRAARAQLPRRPDAAAARACATRRGSASRMDERPSALAREAVADGRAVDRLGRAGARRADGPAAPSPRRRAAVERMRDLGLDRALHPALDPDPELVASAALGAAAIGADRALAALAALCRGRARGARPLARRTCTSTRATATRSSRAARVAPRIAAELREREHTPSELRALLGREPPEALALALALGAPVGADPALGRPSCAPCGSRSPAPTCSRPACPRARRSAARSRRRCGRKLDGLVLGPRRGARDGAARSRGTR